MKTLLMLNLFIFLWTSANGQEINSGYDPTVAKALGADDYGMKNYVLVILKTGSKEVEDKVVRDSLFSGHLQNIRRLAELGKLIVAGPLGKNDNAYRGIFILDVRTFEEAQELLETDITIKEKLLEAELYQWYGAAALPEYLKTQEKITKYEIK